MSEFIEGRQAEQGSSRGRRALIALGLGLGLFVLGALAFLVPDSESEKAEESRAVRTASPKQVAAPGREVREAEGLLEVGQRMPSFALPDLAGHMTPSSSLRGKPLVLNVWASWCPPCLKEMPALKELHRALGDDARLVTIAVDDDVRDARGLAERMKLEFPVLLDPGGDLVARFGTVMFPETWIFDADGKLLERVVGERDWASPEVVRALRAGKPTGLGG